MRGGANYRNRVNLERLECLLTDGHNEVVDAVGEAVDAIAKLDERIEQAVKGSAASSIFTNAADRKLNSVLELLEEQSARVGRVRAEVTAIQKKIKVRA